jgi:hypothetical protein
MRGPDVLLAFLPASLLAPLLLSACGAAAAPGGAPSTTPGTVASGRAPDAVSGPATFVVTLEQEVATPVLRGPFMVTSINPGTQLELGLVAGESCEQVQAWFDYSGGGVGVAAGQVLCVRSSHYGAENHGVSGLGRGGDVPEVPAPAAPAAPAAPR